MARLGRPVVDGEPRVVEVTNERSPLIPGILDGLTEQTLRRRVSMLHFEPVGELGEDRPGPRSSPRTTSASVNVLAELVAFVLDLAFDGVERADEGQRLDRPRVARLGLDEVSSGMHPAAQMPNVVVHRVVAVVGVGVDEAAVAGEERLTVESTWTEPVAKQTQRKRMPELTALRSRQAAGVALATNTVQTQSSP